jgi:putative hydrolase of the HAD superfamily
MPEPSAKNWAAQACLRQADAVIFDAVGTLIFPEPPAATIYADVGRRYGGRRSAAEIAPRFAAAFRRQEQLDETLGWRTSEQREVERWRTIVTEVLDDVPDRDACFRELFEHFRRPSAWRLADEAAATLAKLAEQGHLLGLASNYDSRLRDVVAGLPALAPIRYLAISSEIGWRKPAPQFFQALARLVGLPSDRLVLVGDDPVNDYEGARAAGLGAILLDRESKQATAIGIPRLGELMVPPPS